MNRVENITPYGADGDGRAKGAQVRDMFDSIAPAYDLMNRMMTFGIDSRWRRRCVDIVAETKPRDILDLATGTADLAIELARAVPGAAVTGADLSEGMIEIGRRKAAAAGVDDRLSLVVADALTLPFDDDSFDAVTIAFGVRNFENLANAYREIRRVLRPGGLLVALELTEPAKAWVKPFYKVYTKGVIPLVGRIMSRDRRAYSYLPESIAAVPSRGEMTALIAGAGFRDAVFRDLTLGVANIYTAVN